MEKAIILLSFVLTTTIQSLFFKSEKCKHNPHTKNKCTKKGKYALFVDDGENMLSRLYLNPCEKHLTNAIKYAWEYNEKKGKI